MARIYARKRGKSGSKRPLVPAQWVSYSPEEVEKLILKLAKDGMQTAQIGLVLRDRYGIPSISAVTGRHVSKILEQNEMAPKIPKDLFNLLKKAVNLHNHMSKNKSDAHSKHGLELLESKIRRLGKYYVATKRLPEGWAYDAEQAKLTVEKGK